MFQHTSSIRTNKDVEQYLDIGIGSGFMYRLIVSIAMLVCFPYVSNTSAYKDLMDTIGKTGIIGTCSLLVSILVRQAD